VIKQQTMNRMSCIWRMVLSLDRKRIKIEICRALVVLPSLSYPASPL